MGDRISIQFQHGQIKSVALFSHWGGKDFLNQAYQYAKALQKTAKIKGDMLPLYRLDPESVLVDFISYLTAYEKRGESGLYLGATENDGDNSDNGHYIIRLDEKIPQAEGN